MVPHPSSSFKTLVGLKYQDLGLGVGGMGGILKLRLYACSMSILVYRGLENTGPHNTQ